MYMDQHVQNVHILYRFSTQDHEAISDWSQHFDQS